MKKLATLAVLPVIALASCSKTPENTETSSNAGDTTNSTSVETTNQTSSSESLNENISTGVTDSSTSEIKDFSFNYDFYGKNINVIGTFTLADGKISSVTFSDKTNYEIGQQPLKMFTDKISKDLVGKTLSGLQIDTVSGASLVSGAFNTYLASLK